MPIKHFLVAKFTSKVKLAQLSLVKYIFSKKATKIDEIFTSDLTLTR